MALDDDAVRRATYEEIAPQEGARGRRSASACSRAWP